MVSLAQQPQGSQDAAKQQTQDESEPQFVAREVAPIPVIDFGHPLGESFLDLELVIRLAEEGDRASWARLYNFAARSMKDGYALPDPLHQFIASRLAGIASLLGSGAAIDNAWRNKLSIAVKGRKKLKRKSERRFNKDTAQMSHLVNRIEGLESGDSHKKIATQLGISIPSVKRLIAPSKTKGSGKF